MSRLVVHSSILPSMNLSARWFLLQGRARDCVCMGDVGGDAPGHHQGEIAPRGHGKIKRHPCMQVEGYPDVRLYARILVCLCVLCTVCMCILRLYVLTLIIHTCILTLRGFGCQRETKHWRVCRATSS